MQLVTLTQLSQSDYAKVAKKHRKMKHGGTHPHAQPGVPLASLQELARNQPNAAPGQMVTVQVSVQVPRVVTATNAETVKACLRLQELRSASRGRRSPPGVQKTIEEEFPTVKYVTIKKLCTNDPKTGQQRYKKLEGVNAPTPVERARGGKESVLSKEFLLHLFATIVFLAFSSNPLTDVDIMQIIRTELVRKGATYLKGSRKKAKGKKLEQEVSYENQQDFRNLYRQAITSLEQMGCDLKVRRPHAIAYGRVLAQSKLKLEDFKDMVNYRLGITNEKLIQFLAERNQPFKLLSLDNFINFDETMLDLNDINGAANTVVPADCRVQHTVPSEMCPHITLIIATLGNQIISAMVIIATGKETKLVSRFTRDRQFGKYVSNNNGWVNDELKNAFIIDVIQNAWKYGGLMEGEPMVAFCDGHGTNTKLLATQLLRGSNTAFIVYPSKLTAFLQPLDAGGGAISCFKTKVRTLVANEYRRQALNGEPVRYPDLNKVVEQALYEFHDDPECRRNVIKSWESCGYEQISHEEAFKRHNAAQNRTDDDSNSDDRLQSSSPVLPRVNYDPWKVKKIANGMEDWENKPLSEVLKAVPKTIQNDVAATFKTFRDKSVKTNNFANVSTAGMDLSVAGNADDINVRNKDKNTLVGERAEQRKKLKVKKKELVDAVKNAEREKNDADKEHDTYAGKKDSVKSTDEMIRSVKISAQLLREKKVPLPKDDAEDKDEFTVEEVYSKAGEEHRSYLESYAVNVMKTKNLKVPELVNVAILCNCLEAVNKANLKPAKQKALVEAGMAWTFKSLETNYDAKLSELKTKQTMKNQALTEAKEKRDDFDNDESNEDILKTDRRDMKVRVLTKEEATNVNLQTAQRECIEQNLRLEIINKIISDEREKILNKMIEDGELDPKDKYTEGTTNLVASGIMKSRYVQSLLDQQRDQRAAGGRVADYLPVNGANDFNNYGIMRSLLDNNNGEGEERNTGDDDDDNNREGEERNIGDDDDDDDGDEEEGEEEEDEQD